MTAVVLALGASLCWGLADFGGGFFSRRTNVLLVLLGVEGGGLLAIAAYLAITGEPAPPQAAVLAGLGAGLAGVLALGCFYRALAVGTMGLVAPVSATGVSVPVVVGLAGGDALSTATGIGVVLAIAGILLASREVGGDVPAATRAGLGLALLAALGFGLFFLLADRAAEDSVAWSLFLARAIATPLVLVAVLVARPALPSGATGAKVLAVGFVDLAATACFASALNAGSLSVVSVLGALYPVWTVLLARAILHERLAPVQAVGVGCALAGVGLVAAGGA